jgi:solute:Na+ symporter, SSS family
MLSPFDYGVVTFYLLFLLGIGWYFRRAGHDSSEYFRGGGKMAWWMVGASSFMSAFSAWTFTGAAGLAYTYGLVVLVLFWCNALGFLLNWTYFARFARNSRAVTALEAVRRRLGPVNEQTFTWLQLPFQILQAGIWLYGLAIFCTPVFGLDLRLTIIVCGTVVVFLSAAGGSWAVVTGDFIQALVLVPITFVAAFTALRLAGGFDAFTASLPDTHLQLISAAEGFGPWWVLAVILEKILHINGLHNSTRYLCAVNGAEARKAAMLSAALFLVGSFVWFIPPLVAQTQGMKMDSSLGVVNPAEMSYITIAAQTLPAGLLGLLVTGIISSTMSSMDSGLNRNAGIFVRSFYMPVFRPKAGERELVLVGRVTTGSFGAMAILMALFYSSWRDLGVFSLMMNFSALVATPYAVPLFWCLIVRRSPDWAAWSTVAVCCVVGMAVSLVPGSAWAASLPSEGIGSWLGWAKVNNYAAITIANAGIGSLWFLGASAWRGRAVPPERQAEVKAFFTALHTDISATESFAPDHRRHLGIARMCLVYGAFILALAVFATDQPARLGLLGCAGFMGTVGTAISLAAKRGLARQATAALAANSRSS